VHSRCRTGGRLRKSGADSGWLKVARRSGERTPYPIRPRTASAGPVTRLGSTRMDELSQIALQLRGQPTAREGKP